MFIEVTNTQFDKKHMLNVSYIVEVVDNNKDEWFPCTEITYHNSVITVKESYDQVKKAIDKATEKGKQYK